MRGISSVIVGVAGLGVIGALPAMAGPTDALFIRGLTWDGEVVDIDINTGHATQITSGAGFRANSMTLGARGEILFVDRGDGRTLKTLSADGTSIVDSRTFSDPLDVRSLAMRPNGDFVSFGPHPTEFGAGMWQIDGDTLEVSGPSRVLRPNGTPYSGFQSAEYSPDGDLYLWYSNVGAQHADGLVRVDPDTGIATDVSPVTNNGAAFQSIAFSPDGRLFGATAFQFADSGIDDYALYEIDVSTGAVEWIGSFGADFDVRGIAVIPAPSGVIVLGLGSLIGVRRRR